MMFILRIKQWGALHKYSAPHRFLLILSLFIMYIILPS